MHMAFQFTSTIARFHSHSKLIENVKHALGRDDLMWLVRSLWPLPSYSSPILWILDILFINYMQTAHKLRLI